MPEGAKKADLMFLQHMIACLKSDGLLATVMPHGVLFRGGDEKRIRAGMLEDDLVEAVIGLAPNLFYGTGIPAAILILRNKGAKPANRQGKVLFINGEGFLYLGRSYRLKIVDSQDEALKLVAGYFCLRKDALPRARETFIRWYAERGRVWLTAKVREHPQRMEVAPADVRVQDLGYRWGPCGKGNRVYFHWKTILLPRPIAEYVVVHELVHLHEPHHTLAFWRRMERVMPDYERRKKMLLLRAADMEAH